MAPLTTRAGLLLVVFLATLPADAQVQAKPESVGMSSERLSRIGPWLDGIVETKRASGFVSLVARRGKVIHHQAHGMRGFGVSDPMPLDGIFALASMTKPITVVAALMLLEEGAFALDDPLALYLPEFENPQVRAESGQLVPAERPITIRHLFLHQSGIDDPRRRLIKSGYPNLDAYVREVARNPLAAQPGSRWVYGESFDILGYLVQRVSGRPLDQFLKERILDPLGMSDTQFWPSPSEASRRAIIGREGIDMAAVGNLWSAEAAEAKTFMTGAWGLQGTAIDYWKFCQMLLNGGEFGNRRLLGPRTVALINKNHDTAGLYAQGPLGQPGRSFGLGVSVVVEPALYASKGSYSWGGGLGTTFWIDPSEDLIAVLLVQIRPPSQLRLRDKFSAIVYSSILD